MSKKYIFSTLVLAAFLLLSNLSFGQAKYNFEIGFSYCMATAEYKTSTRYFNDVTSEYFDSTHKETIKSKGGFGGMLGHHFPLIKMGEYSSISMSISYMYDALLWEPATTNTYNNGQGGTTTNVELTSATIKMGLPIGVDYKFGCDAVSDKSRKLTASFGAGIYPALLLTAFYDQADAGFKLQPYIKGEIGIFAGICMKLRGTYTFGKVNYIDYSNNSDYYGSSTVLKGKSAFTVSLIFEPLSFKWKRNEWWGN